MKKTKTKFLTSVLLMLLVAVLVFPLFNTALTAFATTMSDFTTAENPSSYSSQIMSIWLNGQRLQSSSSQIEVNQTTGFTVAIEQSYHVSYEGEGDHYNDFRLYFSKDGGTWYTSKQVSYVEVPDGGTTPTNKISFKLGDLGSGLYKVCAVTHYNTAYRYKDYNGIYTINYTTTPAPTYYTVTFNLDGGTRTGGGALSQSIESGKAATAPTCTRSGYTFNGWDKTFNNVTGNMTVTAKWTANPPPVTYYTVTFDLANGTRTGGGQLVQSIASGSAASAPTATKEGYTLKGWDKTFSNVTGNMTVTAVWEIRILTVTLIVPNQAPIVISVEYGTTIVAALTELNAVSEEIGQMTVQGVVYTEFNENAGLYADSYFAVGEGGISDEPNFFWQWLLGILGTVVATVIATAIITRSTRKGGNGNDKNS